MLAYSSSCCDAMSENLTAWSSKLNSFEKCTSVSFWVKFTILGELSCVFILLLLSAMKTKINI